MTHHQGNVIFKVLTHIGVVGYKYIMKTQNFAFPFVLIRFFSKYTLKSAKAYFYFNYMYLNLYF